MSPPHLQCQVPEASHQEGRTENTLLCPLILNSGSWLCPNYTFLLLTFLMRCP